MQNRDWHIDGEMLGMLYNERYALPDSSEGLDETQRATPTITLIIPREQTTPENLTFLGKVMAAVHVSMDSCEILDENHLPDYQELITDKKPGSKMIFFGIPVPELGQLYQLVPEENITVLGADHLLAIQQDNAKKRLLWESLKKLFS